MKCIKILNCSMCPYCHCQKIDEKFNCLKVRISQEGYDHNIIEYLRTCYPNWCPLDYCSLTDDGK
jgi:hypothetical protein